MRATLRPAIKVACVFLAMAALASFIHLSVGTGLGHRTPVSSGDEPAGTNQGAPPRNGASTGTANEGQESSAEQAGGVLDYGALEAAVAMREPLGAVDALNLRDAAIRGDLRAARILYRASERCASAPRTDEEFLNVIEKIRSSTTDLSFAEYRVESETKRYSRCRPFVQFTRSFRSEMLRVAAEAGDNEARIEFFYERPIEHESTAAGVEAWRIYRRRVARYLMSAVDDGDIEALSRLSDAHLFGIVPSPDPVKSYKFLFAYALARGTVTRSPDGQYLSPRELGRAGARLGLTTAEISEAERAAVRLVESCCVERRPSDAAPADRGPH